MELPVQIRIPASIATNDGRSGVAVLGCGLVHHTNSGGRVVRMVTQMAAMTTSAVTLSHVRIRRVPNIRSIPSSVRHVRVNRGNSMPQYIPPHNSLNPEIQQFQ